MPEKNKLAVPYAKARTRLAYLAFLLVFAAVCLLVTFVIKTKEYAYDTAHPVPVVQTAVEVADVAESFPLGVDPSREVIVENPRVDTYFSTHLSSNVKKERTGWLHRTLAMLSQFAWYQNLASPISRILVVDSGERKEEIARNFGGILRWTDEEEDVFVSLVAGSSPEITEGKFTPGHYVVNKDATPQEVAQLINDQFSDQILSRYPESLDEVVPLKHALTIASLLEREAYDFEDMRYIAGVIWNRLFIDMKLQLDASLQYAKANQGGAAWWPQVVPQDKYIDSPFNTYLNKGLPPSPIANPSTEAILAALNPKITDCLFYFHDRNGGFHCTVTYEEHVALLRKHYGQGR